MNIHDQIELVFEREGRRYENVKFDRGGPTKYGITQGRLSLWRGRRVSADEVKALTEDEARKIYVAHYYEQPRINMLPDEIQAFVFDFYVTSGTWSIKCLQNVLNDIGAGLPVDGVIGTATLDAAWAAHDAMGPDLGRALVVERTFFFGRIVANSAEQVKFLRGWVNQRARAFWRELEAQ